MKARRRTRTGSRAIRIATLLSFAALVQGAAWIAAAAPPEYDGAGEKTCLDCHGNPRVMGIMGTVHMKGGNPNAPAAQKACESCHGPSKAHVQFPMQVENLHFGKKSTTDAKVQNRVCLECHDQKDKARANWKASAHGSENVVCSTCHSIHDPKRVVPTTAARITTCTSAGCHATLMGDADPTKFSHAVGKPLDSKGEMTCSGCHNPHGPLSSSRCIDCHPQTADVLAKQSEKARRFHQVATERGTECIRCHKALAHPIRPLELQKQEELRKEHGPSAG
jgi:nitrate/TMAO reductase-like tetraheme cytochrome c subunit